MANKTPDTPATIRAVLKYVADINTRADRTTAADPWAQPYRITEDSAKRLVRACAKARELKLPFDATTDEKALARAWGPSDAIATIAVRVIGHATEYRQQTEAAERKDARHRRRQKQAARDREAARQRLTPGQRIDRALATLATTSSVTASKLDGDVVTGSKDHDLPRVQDDPLHVARRVAERAVREIEDEVENAKRRRVELEAA